MAIDLKQALIDEIIMLKKQRNAIILAHNYELPEIQDIADVLGDSLALARTAAKTDADVIAFCGVHFMAETAAILNPNKKVLLPDLDAGCSLADSITAEQLRAWKEEHPGAIVVAYVNTTAEVKALSDYCCTSANAVDVVNAIPAEKEVLFLPDMFLGAYVKRMTGRENMQIWMGECHVHAGIAPTDVESIMQEHPDAELLIHPECGCSTSSLYMLAENALPDDRTHILSTGGMLKYVEETPNREFIVATETGIIHQMQKNNPNKTFHAANRTAICPFMKMITLEKLRDALKYDRYVIEVPEELREKALKPIERMIAIG